MGSMLIPPGQPAPLGPKEFESASQPSAITFKLRDLSPQSDLYIRPEEVFRLFVMCSNPHVTEVDANYRILLPDGTLHVGVLRIVPPTNRVSTFTTFNLPEGYLVNVSLNPRTDGQPVRIGECFASVVLQRGTLSPGDPNVMLVSGYIAPDLPISWPSTPPRPSVEGAGIVKSVAFGTPPVGVDMNTTVPTGARWSLMSLFFSLTTSATVINRTPRIRLTDPSGIEIYRCQFNSVVPASTSVALCASTASQPAGVDTTTLVCPIPTPTLLLQGSGIRTITLNLQGGDQYFGGQLLVTEWLEE